MSSLGRRRYCVFGCSDLGAYMHGFSHPERRSEMFKKWVSIIGNKLTDTDPLKIYKNKKVCAHHFTFDQKVASHRLKDSAVPYLYLEGIFSSPHVLVQLEHNYCIQGVQSSDPGLQTSYATMSPIDTESSEQLWKEFKTAQKEIKLLKTQLRKSKQNAFNYKLSISAMENASSDMSAFDKVTKI